MALSVASNSLSGVVSEVKFSRLSRLKLLDMAANAFIIDVNSHWIPPFQLQMISISSCKLGPKFPAWLQTQKSLTYLDISKARLVDAAPDWFWNFAACVKYIKLSNNAISGDLSSVLLNSSFIDLSSNHFRGQLPLISPHITMYNVANNSFSGPISPSICSVVNLESKLEVMDLSRNNLSGDLPDCWRHWQSLLHLNLGSNILSGKIPNSLGSLLRLQSLHLANNSLFGDIPHSLKNCKDLKLIDLGVNQLAGNIPNWMGEWTRVLQLRSNKFSGNIPPQICQISSLIVLDFSNNSLSGSIPKCLNNISAMVASDNWHNDEYGSLDHNYDYGLYLENLMLMTKGKESEYTKNLGYLRTTNLSSNNFSGSIPTEIFLFAKLQSLNLSQNHLIGKISKDVGSMKSLEIT
ncbi:hypothetical protein SO802_014706 [Lithocarpus litseifolius]|uniref:Uncharacterized protein n=1 Tax=Lithocarpus litseifolius TaxID=425828 RepID=A0AAW2CVT1_9ROSI